jgi:hypothetical protein
MILLLATIISFWDCSYNIATEFTYDNNLFNYSAEYINDFMEQLRPYRFPFETYDDLRTSTHLSLLIRNEFFSGRTTTFNVYVSLNNHLINNQKDYQKLLAGIRQSFGPWALKATYDIIPGYLIRYYRNPHGSRTDYIGCKVTYRTLTGKLTIQPRPQLAFDLWYKLRQDDYIDEFSAFDAHAHVLGVGSEIELVNNLTMNINYEIKSSSTDTANVATSLNEDAPDGSYVQHTIDWGARWAVKLLLPTYMSCGYEYTFRNYQSQESIDSLHYGRQDHTHQFFAGAEMKLFAGIHLILSYDIQWRKATSEVFTDIGRLKDYGKYRLGAGVRLYY